MAPKVQRRKSNEIKHEDSAVSCSKVEEVPTSGYLIGGKRQLTIELKSSSEFPLNRIVESAMRLILSAAAVSASTIAVVLSASSIVQGTSASRVERQTIDRSLANDKTWTTTEQGNCWE